MDYGKFKFQQSKKANEAKKKQTRIQVKEVKFRPGTDEGDYQVKLRNLVRFLAEGNKAKVTLRFRGREMAHQQLGMAVLQRVKGDLETIAKVEAEPRLEGRQSPIANGHRGADLKPGVFGGEQGGQGLVQHLHRPVNTNMRELQPKSWTVRNSRSVDIALDAGGRVYVVDGLAAGTPVEGLALVSAAAWRSVR